MPVNSRLRKPSRAVARSVYRRDSVRRVTVAGVRSRRYRYSGFRSNLPPRIFFRRVTNSRRGTLVSAVRSKIIRYGLTRSRFLLGGLTKPVKSSKHLKPVIPCVFNSVIVNTYACDSLNTQVRINSKSYPFNPRKNTGVPQATKSISYSRPKGLITGVRSRRVVANLQSKPLNAASRVVIAGTTENYNLVLHRFSVFSDVLSVYFSYPRAVSVNHLNKFERIFLGVLTQDLECIYINLTGLQNPTPQRIFEYVARSAYQNISRLTVIGDYSGGVYDGDDAIYPLPAGGISYVEHLDFEFIRELPYWTYGAKKLAPKTYPIPYGEFYVLSDLEPS